jgi:hypothetical protein
LRLQDLELSWPQGWRQDPRLIDQKAGTLICVCV